MNSFRLRSRDDFYALVFESSLVVFFFSPCVSSLWDWHIVSLFFITSYFPVSPSARTVNLLTRCTYSQLLLQESSPNEESLDEMRGTSQTTGAGVHHCSFSATTLHVSSHIKDSWFWFILCFFFILFFFRSITCNCMATLTAQTGGSMTKDGSCFTGYSHLLVSPVVVALPLCSGSVSVCSFIGKALVTRRWVIEASVWTGRGGSQEPCHPSAPRLEALLIPSPVSLVTLMLTHTHMPPVFVQIPQIPPDAAGATEQMSPW